jgi:quercetin dioxygenase-like cupin family protein
VIEGRMVFRFDDGHEEIYEAGDAFYTPPGHVPVSDAGTEYVQWSPAEELKRTSDAIMRNMEAMQGGAQS